MHQIADITEHELEHEHHDERKGHHPENNASIAKRDLEICFERHQHHATSD